MVKRDGCNACMIKLVSHQFFVKFLSLTFHWKMLSSMVSASIPVLLLDSMMETKSLVRIPDAAADVNTYGEKMSIAHFHGKLTDP
jgi:hypothetical protein